MSHFQDSSWQDIRICCDVIERVYGPGNFDDAGDVLLAELASIVDYPQQYPCRFEFDGTHLNPQYHVLIFSIRGISTAHYQTLLQRIAAFGLVDV